MSSHPVITGHALDWFRKNRYNAEPDGYDFELFLSSSPSAYSYMRFFRIQSRVAVGCEISNLSPLWSFSFDLNWLFLCDSGGSISPDPNIIFIIS